MSSLPGGKVVISFSNTCDLTACFWAAVQKKKEADISGSMQKKKEADISGSKKLFQDCIGSTVPRMTLMKF